MTPLLEQAFVVLVTMGLIALFLAHLLGKRNRTELQPDDVPRRCSNCQHFDLEEGQAVIRRNQNFVKAAAVLAPQQMGRRISHYDKHECTVCEAKLDPVTGDFAPSTTTADCHVCRGNGYIEQPVFAPTNLPAKTKWSEFGACMLKQEVLWGGDGCDQFLVQLRAKP
jgi:hypothetical protein